MQRPSYHELNGKLEGAKRAVAKGFVQLLSPADLAKDALELDYLVDEVDDVLAEILKEIEPNHYAGSRPPQRSYEPEIKNRELFAFAWNSAFFGQETYFKFVLIGNELWVVSLHQDRP